MNTTWKRDKQEIMAQIQADAAATGEVLSADILENRAYDEGYKKGYADEKAGK